MITVGMLDHEGILHKPSSVHLIPECGVEIHDQPVTVGPVWVLIQRSTSRCPTCWPEEDD